MDIVGAAHGWRGGERPPLQNLSHISYNDKTWRSFTLPKENLTNI